MASNIGRWPAAIALVLSGFTFGYTVIAENIEFPAAARVINVRDPLYGAVGDGIADDTAAIRAALNAARPSGATAKTVYLPNGTYRITDTIAFPNSRHVLQGQSQAGTIIKLADNAVGYDNPLAPKRVVSTRESTSFSANEFRTSIFNLTIDSGSGNPGAVGLKLHQNNQGGVRDITIRSSDPARAGVSGIDLRGSDRGPGYCKNVTIEGFDTGVDIIGTEYSMVFENLTLRNQRVQGIFNIWNILTIRGLISENSVPVVRNYTDTTNRFEWAIMTIIDATLTGGSATEPAIDNQSAIYLRNVTTSGYLAAIREHGTIVPGATIAGEYVYPRALTIHRSQPASLNLPIEDAPEIPWDAPASWASVEAFGGSGTDANDDAVALQAAIDSGASTVYFPAGRYILNATIFLRGNVRRVIGMESSIEAGGALATLDAPVFQVVTDGPPEVLVERISADPRNATMFENTTSRTLILRNSGMGNAHRGSGAGKLFIEDIVGGPWRIGPGQRAWMRQCNPENVGVKVTNDGGQLWLLGLKTEKQGTPLVTRNGGSSEVLGGLIYPVQTLLLEEPMFINDEGRLSVVIGESSYSDTELYRVIVQEKRAGETRRLHLNETPRRVGFGRGASLCLYAGNTTGAPASTPPAANYPLSEGSGATTADASGAGRTATLFGPTWTTGLSGQGLSFDGNDSVQIPAGFMNSRQGSVSVWINTSHDYTDLGMIFYGTSSSSPTANGGGAENELHLNFIANDRVAFFIEGGALPDLSLSTPTALNDGRWHHLVATWNLGGWSDLYVDGRRVASTRQLYNDFDLSFNVRLGRPNAGVRFYNGSLDEVRLFNTAISHAEVLDLYFGGLGVTNYPPAVDAGRDLTVQTLARQVTLEGQATDDGQPSGTLTVGWTVVSGPGTVVFSDLTAPRSTATFSQPGRYTLRLSAEDTLVTTTDDMIVDVFDLLPVPWTNADVDLTGVGLAGYTLYTPGNPAFTLHAAGFGIGGLASSGGDTFHFAYQPLFAYSGYQITALVPNAVGPDADAKAGVMFRQEATERGTANAFLGLTPTGLIFQNRGGSGGGTGVVFSSTTLTAPLWVRMTRVNTNQVRGEYSLDGTAWTDLGLATVNVGGGVRYLGLAATSGNGGVRQAFTFDRVDFIDPTLPRRGDVNCDRIVDFNDIDGFVVALTGEAAYALIFPECDYRNADANADSSVDFNDIDAFVALLVGG